MSLKDAIEKLKYDSRMVEINMKSEILNGQDLKKHLEKLPDLKGNSMSLDIESEGHDDEMDAHTN